MSGKYIISAFFALTGIIFISSDQAKDDGAYASCYDKNLAVLKNSLQELAATISTHPLHTPEDIEYIRHSINNTRKDMKGMDFWFRYLEPTTYKKINAPLPVEWETEVFEKFEKPYKREGAGLMLAYLYLDEAEPQKDSLLQLINASIKALETYNADSIKSQLNSYHHFFLCNRLFLLNLAAIYTTGFECPDTSAIIPELRITLKDVHQIYQAYNQSLPEHPLTEEYIELFNKTVSFVNTQPAYFTQFDHYSFIREYVNPLYALNQELIRTYHVVSKNLLDYSLNKNNSSIFEKSLYNGQDPKGIFHRLGDADALKELDSLGKMLFYDPILSGNNQRSCASCHKPTEYFTDTLTATSMQYDHNNFLVRNSPSLLNAQYNHLLMLDGKHTTLQNQVRAVINNAAEMGCEEKEVLNKVLSCKTYKQGFEKLLQYTPQEKEISFEHIASAITYYYSKFSHYYSPFDDAMNRISTVDDNVRTGFNIFMSKAQCGTCHFVPQFNGVKPPYISSEFEVLGIAKDSSFKYLDADSGRYIVNPAPETFHAFRTGTVRNAANTKPYMHNGIFNTLEQVIDFYDAGGGAGKGMRVENQTLSPDSLKLSKTEKLQLVCFIRSLNEKIDFENAPRKLPTSKIKSLNKRIPGGIY